MSQSDYIKNIAKYGLENDQEKLMEVLNELIEYSKQSKKVNFAIQLQSILKESFRQQKNSPLTRVGSDNYFNKIDDREVNDLILEKLTSDYSLDNLIVSDDVRSELKLFIQEHKAVEVLKQYDLPVANKLLMHGPSGCGKTLASYVIAGELDKLMIVVNLGAIVSSKLGETSKNLSKIFRKAALEDCIIFIDEFDSLGKVRDYSQDHGEMKRVVNTILQLFDYLPQSSIVIAATNQADMLDDALLRRFDVNIELDLPEKDQIMDLINLTLRKGQFKLPSKTVINKIINESVGLSYYSIQKTLVTAIKRSLFKSIDNKEIGIPEIDLSIWRDLIIAEKKSLKK
jgi:SpoVK/Ycf46/Vps4 family AAA+-type ATPase